MNIIQRGGIHRTKHEFGPFNRKYTPKRNKKRALIVQRGMYSKHSFAGLNSPSRGRHLRPARHPFLARLALKRAVCRLRGLGSLIGEQITEASQRKGFVRSMFEAQPVTYASIPRPVTEGPVPNFVVELVDEKFCFLDVVEPEMILELYADIASRMPEGMIPQVGDYQSFDPSDKDGTTGSRVRIHKGKIVEVQRLPKKWEGPYKMLEKTDEVREGWNVWRTTQMFETLREARTVSGIANEPLKAGEAVVINPDGTYSPFKGVPLEGVRRMWLVQQPEELIDDKSNQSIGYIPAGEVSAAELRNLEPVPSTTEWQLPPATPVPGRTIERINETTNLVTDPFCESVKESDTKKEVDDD